jgi:carotenoid cleavage dioxygenase-like enzyme
MGAKMSHFPDLPEYTGFNTPLRAELDITDCEVEGEIPSDIDGAFYRANPDPKFPPLLGKDLYFNGDGVITQFRFKDGKVDLKQRYVRTDKFRAEAAAGRALFGAYRNPFFDDPTVAGLSRGTANTNVLLHAGRMFAYKEDSHPVEIDPITLETKGNHDYGGRIKSVSFTAHAKIDPVSGDMIGFGYDAKGIATPDVAYYVIGPDGEVKHETWFQVPYSNLMHDFGVTQDYVIFLVVPVCSSLERARQGAPTFGWDASKDVFVGIMPRYGSGADLRWFRGPNCFCSHVMNAFNQGTRVYIDVPMSKSNMFPFFPDVTGKPFDREAAAGRMTRWSFDLSKPDEGWEKRQLGNMVGEFPKIDERYATLPYRHGYLCVVDPTLPFSANGGSISGLRVNKIGHVDHATGREDSYWVGEKSSLQEPCFVPRSKTSAEGDGYILVLANRYEESRSDLLLLDAQRLSEGPLAVIRLPIRLRSGLHGNWYDGDQIEAAGNR